MSEPLRTPDGEAPAEPAQPRETEPCYRCHGPTRPHADDTGLLCCDRCQRAFLPRRSP